MPVSRKLHLCTGIGRSVTEGILQPEVCGMSHIKLCNLDRVSYWLATLLFSETDGKSNRGV